MIQKYRAWEISGKRMISVKSIDFVNRFIEYIHRPYSNPNRILSEILEFDQIHLMQSTGLFDSSLEPVEIYKDDIVTKSLPNGAILVGVVTFTKGMFLVDGVEVIDQSWVVIGNIHQHQHLLEGLND